MSIGHFKNTLYCSFCGRSQHEVAQLIAGPVAAYICDVCVRDCIDLIAKTAEEAVSLKAIHDKAVRDFRLCQACQPASMDEKPHG